MPGVIKTPPNSDAGGKMGISGPLIKTPNMPTPPHIFGGNKGGK